MSHFGQHTLRNGEIGFYKRTRLRNRSTYLVEATVANFVLTPLLALIFRVVQGESWYWRIWDIWHLYELGLLSIPGAIICGKQARNGVEAGLLALASIIGVLLFPAIYGDLSGIGLLGAPNLISAPITALFVYCFRRFRGFKPEYGFYSQSSLRCIKCGYWLPGLSERRCPECGTPFGRQDV